MDLNIVKDPITVVIAVLGWIVGHYFNSQRDAAANRKKMVTGYLVDAYRKLNAFACVLASRAKGTSSLAADINSAVGDVQLFGTTKQIQLTKEIAEHMVRFRSIPNQQLTELLHDLRDALRTELKLDAIDTPIAHLNIEFSANEVNQTNKMAGGDASLDNAS